MPAGGPAALGAGRSGQGCAAQHRVGTSRRPPPLLVVGHSNFRCTPDSHSTLRTASPPSAAQQHKQPKGKYSVALRSFFKSTAKYLLKQAAFNTSLYRSLFNVYAFMYSPTELMFLAQCLSDVRAVPGSFVEAGCAYGATTVFLNKYMDEHGIDRDYYAIDTFSGFEKGHINYERVQRKKSAEVEQKLHSSFSDNKQTWFDKTMTLHDVNRVKSIKGDVGEFDFSSISPIAFCLLDVDLYLPIKEALPKIYQAMSPGAITIVDDCWDDEKWDGALQAYQEFIASAGLEHRIFGRKLGFVRRQPLNHA
jgi:SAM-dependent methyltransferase